MGPGKSTLKSLNTPKIQQVAVRQLPHKDTVCCPDKRGCSGCMVCFLLSCPFLAISYGVLFGCFLVFLN